MRTIPVGPHRSNGAVSPVDEKNGALLDTSNASPRLGSFFGGKALQGADCAPLLDAPPSAHRGEDLEGVHELVHRFK